MSHPVRTSTDWGARTPADLSSLLVELERAVRAAAFYPEKDRQRPALLDRAYRAFKSDISRAGPLEIQVGADEIRAAGVCDALPRTGLVEDLGRVLEERQLRTVGFEPGLGREAFHAFCELLGRDDPRLRVRGGFARALSARSRTGFILNGGDDDGAMVRETLAQTPRSTSASLGSALLRAEVASPDAEKVAIHEDPLRAPPGDDRGERLLYRLIELDGCSDDAEYEAMARRIVEWARELGCAGLKDECFRAVLVLADHAVGEGGRSGAQARIAHACCATLVQGAQLADLIQRACSPQDGGAIRAAQVLLHLREISAEALLEQLIAEADPGRSAQLSALMLALGDHILPTLKDRIARGPLAHARLAIRLAGELQNPAMIESLVRLLDGGDPGRGVDAARALAMIGSQDAVRALTRAITHEDERIASSAAHALAGLGDARCLAALLDAFDDAARASRTSLAKELIRALGELGNDRAAPRLIGLLERRSFVRRQHMLELKAAALGALHQLPGRIAREALERASRRGPRVLRERAKTLLSERRPPRTGAVG